MATSIDPVVTDLDAQGNIISLHFSGTSTRDRVFFTLTSQANAAVFASGQSLVNQQTGAWSVNFDDGEDFFAGDIACNDIVDINIEYLFDNVRQQENDYPQQVEVECDACNITIDTVDAVSASGSGEVISIKVTGTANSCTGVVVSISIPGGSTLTKVVDLSNRVWRTSFVANSGRLSLKDFNCGDDIKVAVECKDDRDCRRERTLSLPCRVDCPNFASVVISNASGSVEFTDPQPADLQCLPAGRYTLSVVSPPASTVQSYAWFRNQDESSIIGTGRELPITLAANESVSYSVSVQQTDGCKPSRTLSFACGTRVTPVPTDPPGDNDGDDNGNNNGDNNGTRATCDACCYWFIANIIGTFATLVAFALAGCAFQWLEPISITVAVSLAVAVSASWFAWAFFCRTRTRGSCTGILRWLDILDVLTALAALVAFAVGTTSPCAIAFWINVGFLQWIRRGLQSFAVWMGCLPNPWWRD